MPLNWFRRLCLAGALLALGVVVLGAWVRLSHAGLGCPDWPGCYGHLTVGDAVENAVAANAAHPERPLEADKAVKEMVHRYFASALGLLIVLAAVLAFRNRRDPAQPVRLPAVLVLLVVFQGLLGMWTVTLLLKPLIVSAHLVGGLTTMSLLWWLSFDARPGERPAVERGLRTWAIVGLVALALQIMLGGWVSSNYSAIACPDFPTCQASYWPHMDFEDAFVLWRGLGIDYEGGVLDHPARVAIHFTHRIGAVVVAFVLGYLFVAHSAHWPVTSRADRRGDRRRGTRHATGGRAPLMVVKTFPLWLATAHNAVAALLLLSVVALARFLFVPRRTTLIRAR